MATVVELRAQAKAKGIRGYSRMRKAELERALKGKKAPALPPSLPKRNPRMMFVSSVRQCQNKITNREQELKKKYPFASKSITETAQQSRDVFETFDLPGVDKDVKHFRRGAQKCTGGVPINTRSDLYRCRAKGVGARCDMMVQNMEEKVIDQASRDFSKARGGNRGKAKQKAQKKSRRSSLLARLRRRKK